MTAFVNSFVLSVLFCGIGGGLSSLNVCACLCGVGLRDACIVSDFTVGADGIFCGCDCRGGKVAPGGSGGNDILTNYNMRFPFVCSSSIDILKCRPASETCTADRSRPSPLSPSYFPFSHTFHSHAPSPSPKMSKLANPPPAPTPTPAPQKKTRTTRKLTNFLLFTATLLSLTTLYACFHPTSPHKHATIEGTIGGTYTSRFHLQNRD